MSLKNECTGDSLMTALLTSRHFQMETTRYTTISYLPLPFQLQSDEIETYGVVW